MLESAISSAKWLIDTLLKKRNEDKTSKRQKWVQVADYLELIAKLIDNAISDYYDKNELPHGLYAQLEEMQYDFMSVLKQVYDKDKDKDTIERYYRALSRALHFMAEGDTGVLVNESPRSKLRGIEGVRGKGGAASCPELPYPPQIKQAFDPKPVGSSKWATLAKSSKVAARHAEAEIWRERYAQEIRANLQTVAGQFRAGATTLRAGA